MLTSYLAILSDGQLGPAPDTWSAALKVMADKARQLNRMIDDLVDAARIEANALPSRHSQVDLRDVVRDAVERARALADLTGARIVTREGPDPVTVDADALQLGRILDVLMSNGLTFNSRLPRLDVSAVREKKRAIVRVADNGVGFSEEEKDSAFEPFYQGKDPAFSGVRGSGLGLYIGRQLAEANGGSLTIEHTAPGQGTDFALVLPVANAAKIKKAVRKEVPDPSAGDTPSR